MNYADYPVPSWVSSSIWRQKKTWVKDAIIRDSYSCRDCHNGTSKLLVYHIDKNPKNNTPNNLVTLCRPCFLARQGKGFKKNPIIEKLKRYVPSKEISGGTLTIIANEFGLSRERVRQVAKKEGYLMPHETAKKYGTVKCWVCGKTFYDRKNLTNYLCSPGCRRIHYEQKYWGIYPCEECGLYFKHRKALMETRGKRFCSHVCQGRQFGRLYGWGREGNRGLIKYESLQKLAKDFPDGFTIKRFGEKYGYASLATSHRAVFRLMLAGDIKKGRRGLYRVTQGEKDKIEQV